jgi:hypothetical protein
LPFPSLIGGLAGAATLLIVLIALREEVAWRALRMLLPDRKQEPRS